jgi:hypothetical protein
VRRGTLVSSEVESRATLSAGDRRGAWFLPEVGDEVLVATSVVASSYTPGVGNIW